MTKEDKQKLFLIALQACNGNITKTCEACAMSRQSYYKWMNAEDQTFAEKILEIQTDAIERRIDLAESKIDKLVEMGSGPDIRFILKTLGANRGYGNRQEVTVRPGEGFANMLWPEETPSLEDWETKRDLELIDDED